MAKNKSSKKPKVAADKFAAKRASSRKSKEINPFEVHTNKEKFSVVGRYLKHDKGMPGISRTKATQKRKQTLGQEYVQKNKTNKFKDNRVGKYGMSKEDAAGARFVAERLNQFKSKKQSLYNLNEDELLTHKGQTLEEIEQFQDTISDDEEDDDVGKLDAEFTGAAHFGGDDDSGKRKNAIEDLIAEQKRRKAEVSREKDEVTELTQRLDENWRDLLGLMDLAKGDEERPKQDDFDRALKEMVFEPRGTVTDKLKSEEKLLRTEKWRLQQLEQERLDRMHGLTEEEKKAKHRSADDLDDGYYLNVNVENDKNSRTLAYDDEGQANRRDDDSDEELDRLIKLSKTNGQENGDDEDASEDDSEKESESGDDDESEGSDDEGKEHEFSDLVYDSSSEDEANKSRESTAKRKRTGSTSSNRSKTDEKLPMTEQERQAMMDKAAKELPYTFELPHNYGVLEKLLAKRNADYQAVIVDRMIKCNHPKVEPTNKEHMVTLFAFLLQHINDVAANATVDNVEHCFAIVDRLTPYLHDLSNLSPVETTKCFLEVIKEKQSEYRSSEKVYPTLDTFVFLKLAASLYSVSDFRHTIVSPCVILISHMLSRCRVQNRRDISLGLFLVTVVMDYTQLSKRFLPAAVNFLTGVLYLCVPKRPIQQMKVIPPFKSSGPASSLLAIATKAKKLKLTNHLLSAQDLLETEIDEAFKVRALKSTLLLTNDLLEQQIDSNCVKFLLTPIETYVNQIPIAQYPPFIAESVENFKSIASKIKGKLLTYLVPAMKKPKTLRQLEPKFERIYDDKRNRRPGQREKAIHDGMIRKIKKETKGAVREIRRDNAFLAKMQLKRQMQRYFLNAWCGRDWRISNRFYGSFSFTAMPSVRRRCDASSLKHPFNKGNSMPWIERRSICKLLICFTISCKILISI